MAVDEITVGFNVWEGSPDDAPELDRRGGYVVDIIVNDDGERVYVVLGTEAGKAVEYELTESQLDRNLCQLGQSHTIRGRAQGLCLEQIRAKGRLTAEECRRGQLIGVLYGLLIPGTNQLAI